MLAVHSGVHDVAQISNQFSKNLLTQEIHISSTSCAFTLSAKSEPNVTWQQLISDISDYPMNQDYGAIKYLFMCYMLYK